MKAIYKITNTVTNKIYVGSTKDFTKRKKTHLRTLRNGTHHCTYLQRSFDKHGDVFEVSVIKELSEDESLFEFEQYYIDTLKPEYNIGSVGGGDNLTDNPNKKAIIAKITSSTNNRYANMTTEEKRIVYGKSGSDNANWKGGHKYFCACGAKISQVNDCCTKCRDRTGSSNSFYGKKHSAETIAKLREVNKGKVPANAKAIMAEGTEYPSMRAAGTAYGINTAAMKYRVDNKNEKWEDFYRKED